MTKLLSSVVSFAALLLATGWLMLSQQTGSPLSPTEYVRLLERLREGVSLRSPAASPASPPAASPATETIAYADLEQSAHDQVNQYRAEQGLPSLTLDAEISAIARSYSAAMASGAATFSHDGFDQRVQAIARVIPYRAVGENLAYNQGFRDPAAQAVAGWINSPGHRANMVGDFNVTGIGVAKNDAGEYYFTQLFIRRLI